MSLADQLAQGIQFAAPPDPFAQYGKMQQLQQGQQQMQISQMQLDELKRDREGMVQFQKDLAAKGGNPDLDEYANMMLRSNSSAHQKMGIELKQKLMEQKQFANIMGGGAPAAAAPVAPAAAPMAPTAAPMALPAAAPENALGSGTFGMAPAAAPVNALAPPPAASVNAFTPNPAAGEVTELRRKRDALLAMGTPRAIAAAKALDSDIAIASKEDIGHVVPGVGLVSNRTGNVIRASVEPTAASLKEFEAFQKMTPVQQAAFMQMKRSGQPSTTVQLPPQEKAEQGARGTLLVKEYGDISASAKLAAKTIPSIDANLNILNKGFETGFGTETKAAGAKIWAALGVQNAENFATDAQAFQAKATEMVLQKQLEQKGPQTESDAQRIDQVGAQLGKTTAGNKFVLTTAKEQYKRDMEQRNFYDSWWKNNKTYDGAESAWYAGEGGKSLFDRPALKQYAGGPNPVAEPRRNAELDKIFNKKP